MIKLYKGEICWLRDMVVKEKLKARKYIHSACPEFKALQELRYENMKILEVKLEALIHGKDKRIEVVR